MAVNRHPLAGRILKAVFGFARGTLQSDFDTGLVNSISCVVNITEWDDDLKQWNGTGDTVNAYPGIPFQGKITAGKVVWMIYFFKNYFIIAAECETDESQ